jgi:hypothetical protein
MGTQTSWQFGKLAMPRCALAATVDERFLEQGYVDA